MKSNRESKVTVSSIRRMKNHTKITVLTAVDMPTAKWCDSAGIDIILVGDSLAMTSLGMDNTRAVTMEQMLSAVAAVRRGLSETPPLVVADIPLSGLDAPVESARAFINAGADCVKIECHEIGSQVISEIVSNGIEVMAHVGLMPQTVSSTKGYKLKGADSEEAEKIIETAKKAEKDGAFSCVIEKVPLLLAEKITSTLSIPTIGIGAGNHCDGQVLVLHDVLGIFERFRPKFVRRYLELTPIVVDALQKYVSDVREGKFPSIDESFE